MNVEEEIKEIKKELAGFEKGLIKLTREITDSFKMITESIIKAFTDALKQTEQEIKPINKESERIYL